MGVFIRVFGIFTRHPVLRLPMTWWFRAPVIGAWMNLVLAFFAYDVMAAARAAIFGADSAFTSPFWFTFEGAIVGLIMSYFATLFGAEGQ